MPQSNTQLQLQHDFIIVLSLAIQQPQTKQYKKAI